MAEAIARAIAGASVLVESAGTEAGEGLPATKDAVTVMSERGADITSHRSRSLESIDVSQFDLVFAMTPLIGERVRRLGVDAARIGYLEVEDPYGRGLAAYRTAAEEIEHALRPFLAAAR